MAILEVKGLKKSFGANEVLKGIDFELNRGEVLAIIGSSRAAARRRCSAASISLKRRTKAPSP